MDTCQKVKEPREARQCQLSQEKNNNIESCVQNVGISALEFGFRRYRRLRRRGTRVVARTSVKRIAGNYGETCLTDRAAERLMRKGQEMLLA